MRRGGGGHVSSGGGWLGPFSAPCRELGWLAERPSSGCSSWRVAGCKSVKVRTSRSERHARDPRGQTSAGSGQRRAAAAAGERGGGPCREQCACLLWCWGAPRCCCSAVSAANVSCRLRRLLLAASGRGGGAGRRARRSGGVIVGLPRHRVDAAVHPPLLGRLSRRARAGMMRCANRRGEAPWRRRRCRLDVWQRLDGALGPWRRHSSHSEPCTMAQAPTAPRQVASGNPQPTATARLEKRAMLGRPGRMRGGGVHEQQFMASSLASSSLNSCPALSH